MYARICRSATSFVRPVSSGALSRPEGSKRTARILRALTGAVETVTGMADSRTALKEHSSFSNFQDVKVVHSEYGASLRCAQRVVCVPVDTCSRQTCALAGPFYWAARHPSFP